MHSVGIQELTVLVLVLAIIAMPIWTAVWVYRDATRHHNKDATIWTVGSLLVWPIVIIVYLIVRPGSQNGAR